MGRDGDLPAALLPRAYVTRWNPEMGDDPSPFGWLTDRVSEAPGLR